MSIFGAHGLSRAITLKFYEKMQNVIVINIQGKNWQYFLAIWPLAAIQKAKNCHFSQISELTYTMQIIYQNEALDISFSQKLISRSFKVTQGQKSRKKGQISIFFKVDKWYLKMKLLASAFQEKLVSRSFEFIRGQKSGKKVKFQSFLKAGK